MAPHMNFSKGINLGGWLSQYRIYDITHFESFIKEEDLDRIASWGLDHVRLPVDYPVLESQTEEGGFEVAGFSYIDRCLGWCQHRDLDLIIDLHNAPGYDFDNWQAITLFDDPSLLARFINIWAAIARHYQGTASIAFELLNEIMIPDSKPWNQLVRDAIATIHSIDPDRLIILGGNHHNQANELRHLDFYETDKVRYTFHHYHPMVVTHQKAYWSHWLKDLAYSVDYPGIYPDITAFGTRDIGKLMDRNLLEEYLQPAIDFSRQTGKRLYCGEFGVVDQAPMPTRVNWTRDMLSLFDQHNIGWALWSYKAMDFGLVDKNGEVICPELIDLISQR